jgi:hypothetical protein
MNRRAQFINDRESFDRYWHAVRHIFESRRRPPQQVFKQGYGQFVFCAFDLPMSPDFWPALQQSSFVRHDDSVVMIVLDPDPAAGFGQPIGPFAAFTLPVTAEQEAYTEAIWTIIGTDVAETGRRTQAVPTGRSGDCMMILAETVIWMSETLEWALWAERSEAIGVLAVNIATPTSRPSFDQNWLSIDRALGLVSMKYRSLEVPSEWESEFRRNYAPN